MTAATETASTEALATAEFSAPNAADRIVKRDRVLAILAAHGGRRVALTSQAAVSWYLDGSRTHVSLAGDPILAVLVDESGDTVVTSRSERARLEAEELPAGITIRETDWAAPLSAAWADDPDVLAETALAAPLRAARAPLLPTELARFRALGAANAEVLTDVLGDVDPGDSERAVAARIGERLLQAGIEPLVLLAAGRSRLGYRHPLPTDAVLGNRALVVVCARRHGLILNLSRWVRFDEASSAEADAQARLYEVEAAFFDATRPGELVSDVFARGCAGYAAAGFDADEWLRHHQGGPAGYNGRDPRAGPGLPDRVQANGAFTWNPSAPGAKVEDTVVVRASALEILSVDPRWPSVTVHGRARPAELQR